MQQEIAANIPRYLAGDFSLSSSLFGGASHSVFGLWRTAFGDPQYCRD
jgi:hypothetical protein